MCVISTDVCGRSTGSRSSGSGLGAAAVTAGLLVTAALTYQAMVIAWPVLLVAEIAGLCLVYRRSPVVRAALFVARALLAGGMWLGRWAWRRYRRPSTEVVVSDLAYQATLYVEGKPGENHQIIGRGTVSGPWATVEEAQQAIRDKWLAEAGAPADGALVCHAVPVAS
jgi:hypothetical protein